ncbi:hypothetical protein AOC05_17310 [Arthrobacter alpinus]|uniref:Uncharacterized protein n=2 Tax=Arthrobacter alpinus TaxID=656366 RepID=A0A0M4QYX8_9MICC|nr:hypothetical protein AOC05_17310 [Arthrobacter alpinus]
MAEYSMGAGFPLWSDADVAGTESNDWDLSEELKDALSSWQADFDNNYDPSEGWPSLEFLNRHFREASRLKVCLERELPNNVIDLDYWQLAVKGKEEPLPPTD